MSSLQSMTHIIYDRHASLLLPTCDIFTVFPSSDIPDCPFNYASTAGLRSCTKMGFFAANIFDFTNEATTACLHINCTHVLALDLELQI